MRAAPVARGARDPRLDLARRLGGSGRDRREGSGQQASSRADRLPERFDLSNPYNQRKIDAGEALADRAGLALIQLVLGFAKSHVATSAEGAPTPAASPAAYGSDGARRSVRHPPLEDQVEVADERMVEAVQAGCGEAYVVL